MARTTKAAASLAPEADTKTMDLLADVAPTAGTDLAQAASSEIGALALVTMDPAKYVAAVYQPFRAKFDQLRAEADVIVFSESDRAQVESEQAELPEDQRRAVVVVDITSKDGMSTAIKMRAGFRDDVRISSEKARVGRKAPLLEIGRLLDSSHKALVDESTPYEKYFDTAIEAETKRKAAEKAEQERLAAERAAEIKAALDAITGLPTKHAAATSAELTVVLQELATKEMTEAEFGDKLGEASVAVDTTAGALIALRDGALAREQAEAERIRLQEEEKARIETQAEANRVEAARLAQEAETARAAQAERDRIAAAEQAERDRVAAETKRQLDAQAEQVAAARQAQELEAAKLQAELAQQQAAMADIRSIQQLGELQGTREVADAITIIKAMALMPEKFGAMLDLATMTHDMTLVKLEQRLAGYLAVELPAAHAEALEENARFDIELSPLIEVQTEPMLMGCMTVDGGHTEIDWDALPDTLPLPEGTERDAEINAAPGPTRATDLEIVDLLASEYGMTRSEAIVRLAQIDFKALEEN